MKKVLVTGAAGSVGNAVIKLLLSEGKYEITALDLKNNKSRKVFKKYEKRINIIYGDIGDEALINSLVKDHDIIIHLASVMVPLGNFSNILSDLVEYNGTKNIIKAINKYNKNCHLLYASSTSIYDKSLNANVNEIINEKELTVFSRNKYKVENLIKKELNNYTILRIPLVLNNITNESFVFNVKKNSIIEITTDYDAASCFVKCIPDLKRINKKVYDVGMGNKGIIKYNKIINNILKYNGISVRLILSRLFLTKDYYSPVTLDSDELNNIINYRFDTLNNYYKRLKRNSKKRKIQLILGKIVLLFKRKD